MASISSSNTSIPASWLSESNGTSYRDTSFSSYLNSSEETYIRNLVQMNQSQSQSRQTITKHLDPVFKSESKKVVEDGEIDVFSADKYFKGEVVREHHDTTIVKKKSQSMKNYNEKVVSSLSKLKLQPRTPSSHSESSWNSQSALLRRVQRNPSRGNNNNTSNGGNSKRSFLSSCYCCDKKSVEIETDLESNPHSNRLSDNLYVTRSIKTSLDTAEITRLNKIRQNNNNTNTDLFILEASKPLMGLKKIEFEDEDEIEKIERKSLEVFGSNEIDDEGSKRFSLENKLNMLSWDAIPGRSSIEDMTIDTSGRPSESYRDTESDASSDLFEIECLSCTANPVVQGDGCATPTTAYAPSEASIDWSVVTASAADFSIVSDSDEQRSVLTSVSRRRMSSKPTAKSGFSKEVQKTRSAGMLAGCKSQKAVRVAEDSYRSNVIPAGKVGKSESQRNNNRFSDTFNPVTRFHAESKLPVYGVRQSKTITSSDLLYIQ